MNFIRQIEEQQLKRDIPEFSAGDTIKVYAKVKEKGKERIQVFEGVVIRKARSQNRATFTVRKISFGVGIERIFPLHSPNIEKIEVVRRGKVRRAKLYYLRRKTGRAAKIKEQIAQQPNDSSSVAVQTSQNVQPTGSEASA
jgi:large subunit ribosomal protein L19